MDQILSGTQEALTARRVFGEPIQSGGATILPVAIIRGGGGAGRKNAEQSGIGFGVNARPAGVFVIRDGQATWRPAIDVNRVILGGQLVAMAAIFALRPLIAAWRSRLAA